MAIGNSPPLGGGGTAAPVVEPVIPPEAVRCLYPEAETPLAEIDPLLPTLALFQSLTSGKFMREKAAALRAIALAEKGVWSYSELDAILWWMPHDFKRYIVDQLRESLLVYDEISRMYSLNPQARVVCTVLTALGGKDRRDPRILVGHLLKIQELASVGSDGVGRWDVLRTAVSWLQGRHFDLESAVRQGLVDTAQEKAREMQAVLDQVREFLAAQDAVLRAGDGHIPSEVYHFLREGHRTTAELFNLVRFVYRTLAQASAELLTGARTFTGQDVRRYAGRASRADVAKFLRGTLSDIPWSCPETATVIFAGAVAHHMVRRSEPPPLPMPTPARTVSEAPKTFNALDALARELRNRLIASGAVEMKELVIGTDWSSSSSRGRLLPEADVVLIQDETLQGSALHDVVAEPGVHPVNTGGVSAMTRAWFRSRDVESSHRESSEEDVSMRRTGSAPPTL